MAENIWLLKIIVDNSNFDQAQGILALNVAFGWEEKELPEGKALFAIHYEKKDFLEKVEEEIKNAIPEAKTEITQVEKVDWLQAWRQYFTPVECGSRFVVLPPWLAHMEHTTRKAIIIEPKSAFGTGHHASTRLCLTAISDLADEGLIKKSGWFLDLGCGSGVLGIAASKLGMDGIGLDIDPVAIHNARENRELNEANRLELLIGGIEKIKREKFDLVMANILAKPLIELAPQILAALKKGACLILSGILDSQAAEVAAAYSNLGEPEILSEDEWRALVWKNVKI